MQLFMPRKALITDCPTKFSPSLNHEALDRTTKSRCSHTRRTLIIRIGLGAFYTIIIIWSPHHPILTIKAPTLQAHLRKHSVGEIRGIVSRIFSFIVGKPRAGTIHDFLADLRLRL